jgi:type VII secretion-associated serine protease mycosin
MDEGNLLPAQELSIKQMQVTDDVEATNDLCRKQCAVDLRRAAAELAASGPGAAGDRLAALQAEHPHMARLYYSMGTEDSQAQPVLVGNVLPGVMEQAHTELDKALHMAAKGGEYQSPPITTSDGTYFVMSGMDPGGSRSVVTALVHQHILGKVKEHQIRNLRVVPYPAEGNWKIESVDTDTLQDVNVDHPEENEGTSHYHKNQVVVKFSTPPSEEDLKRIAQELHAGPAQKLGYTYVFESSDMEAQQMMAYFKNWKVEYAEPHYLYLTNDRLRFVQSAEERDGGQMGALDMNGTVPNDALYSRYQWNLPLIETLQGWNIGRGSQDVKVAVVDTGVDLNHPDLKDNLLEGINVVSQGSSPQDDVGHGTHVAGIISALVNNNEGVAGMTWYNPILPVKVLDASGSGSTYAVAQGIIWAADHGAKVINLSLGNYADAQFLHDAIKYAYDKDVVLIAASGNDNTERPGYPAAYEEVFAVAATDAKKNKASFSNYGNYIDVAAPGVSIPSTYPDNQYAALSGTSMASPHVSALAALIRSANPMLKNTEVMEIMRNSAMDIGDQGKDKYFGYGLIDVVKALEMADTSRDSLSYLPEWLSRQLERWSGEQTLR